ncbi:uncharacterized protein LOC111706009 isoform X2 [Eurytemora carolleeae]|uniref:uncharacterized protein LOC111706009 isoform X2 n=1 Tax=Eurytemora carolleeae TaxID=1294199 RepID=UPI000C791784|nr:uncharacterized protein LOC111706009 isoform X2 [Eurytemora carolleeae]|eukprot:XP_023334523.1 uncharacterized protein LOC111706009 isoform X2 [Eurytemora affinis]
MISGSLIMCPYCDPNYMAYPNLEEACRGYDLPMGNPNPDRGKTDPGIRNLIFEPMYRNKDGYYAMQVDFLTANINIKCDASWSSEVYDNFKDYVKGKQDSSTYGESITVTPEIDFSSTISNMDFSTKIPSVFSRSSSTSNDVEKTRDFFTKERGSIAVSEAVCFTERVDISEKSRKIFAFTFELNVLLLYNASFADEGTKLEAFKAFINEFGTHYSSSTEMGTKISVERRYTAEERIMSDKEELRACNTLVGSQVLGFQAEVSKMNCSNTNLMNMGSNSDSLERTVISTFGSFIAESLLEWTEQVITLVQNGDFEPHAIKRKLVPIEDLFLRENFEHLKVDGNKIDVSVIRPWFQEYIARYCDIFQIDCNLSGCGIDDNCPKHQLCKNNFNKTVGKDGLRYTCRNKRVKLILFNGQSYIGEVNSLNQPHGSGKLYRDKLQEILEYSGSFKMGLMDGHGTFYYKNGKIMYDGEWKFGSFIKGKLFTEEGELFNEYL